ncbi:MAG: hypothetical protein HC881_22460 [Leptolyngbyaceae cyanobacterium SL_7_1]|nr:hypothetical protein [Leptolyngbyaceae cyanobacterium SL_7_1]
MQSNQEPWQINDSEEFRGRYTRLHQVTPPVMVDRSPAHEPLQPPVGFTAALGDGVAWIAVSLLVRLGIDALMASSTSFFIPGILLLAAPAVVAVTIALIMPQWSWSLGYRLVLVMFGLLMGGRL